MRAFRQRRRLDPMISMINVVFLLLAFFMMGQFLPVTGQSFIWPQAEGVDANLQSRLIIDADGTPRFQGLFGDAALEALREGQELGIAADARLDANQLIEILSALRGRGVVIVGVEVRE